MDGGARTHHAQAERERPCAGTYTCRGGGIRVARAPLKGHLDTFNVVVAANFVWRASPLVSLISLTMHGDEQHNDAARAVCAEEEDEGHYYNLFLGAEHLGNVGARCAFHMGITHGLSPTRL